MQYYKKLLNIVICFIFLVLCSVGCGEKNKVTVEPTTNNYTSTGDISNNIGGSSNNESENANELGQEIAKSALYKATNNTNLNEDEIENIENTLNLFGQRISTGSSESELVVSIFHGNFGKFGLYDTTNPKVVDSIAKEFFNQSINSLNIIEKSGDNLNCPELKNNRLVETGHDYTNHFYIISNLSEHGNDEYQAECMDYANNGETLSYCSSVAIVRKDETARYGYQILEIKETLNYSKLWAERFDEVKSEKSSSYSFDYPYEKEDMDLFKSTSPKADNEIQFFLGGLFTQELQTDIVLMSALEKLKEDFVGQDYDNLIEINIDIMLNGIYNSSNFVPQKDYVIASANNILNIIHNS